MYRQPAPGTASALFRTRLTDNTPPRLTTVLLWRLPALLCGLLLSWSVSAEVYIYEDVEYATLEAAKAAMMAARPGEDDYHSYARQQLAYDRTLRIQGDDFLFYQTLGEGTGGSYVGEAYRYVDHTYLAEDDMLDAAIAFWATRPSPYHHCEEPEITHIEVTNEFGEMGAWYDYLPSFGLDERKLTHSRNLRKAHWIQHGWGPPDSGSYRCGYLPNEYGPKQFERTDGGGDHYTIYVCPHGFRNRANSRENPNSLAGACRSKPHTDRIQVQCDCDQDLVGEECKDRERDWFNATRDSNTGAILQTLSTNSQNKRCGRIIEGEDCDSDTHSSPLVGNPISCATGQKIQTEWLYRAPTGSLNASVTYRAGEDAPVNAGGATTTYTQPIPNNVEIVEILRPAESRSGWQEDGPQLIRYGTNVTAVVGRQYARLFIGTSGHRLKDGTLSTDEGTTRYTTASGVVHAFDDNDRPISKTWPNGRALDYSYPTDNEKVQTDHTGRSLHTLYAEVGPDGERLPVQLTDPEGHVYDYQYDDEGYLQRIVFPDTTGDPDDNPYREYGYQVFDDGDKRLAWIRDERGIIVSQWAYDERKRAIRSERAGGAGRVEVLYHDDPVEDQVSRTVRTYRTEYDYHEVDRTFAMLNGGFKPLVESPAPCPDCEVGDTLYQYDSNGYLSEKIAPDGTVTRYTHSSRGQQTRRTLAWGTDEEYTVNTSWHVTWNRPLVVYEPHQRTYNTYDAQGNLTVVRVRDLQTYSDRTTHYTYNDQGQVLTHRGPRGETTTYTYDAQGNLASVTNPLGHQSLFTDYDAQGNLLAMTDPNGVQTTLTYHPRGWLTSTTVDGQTTEYHYDAAGQLIRVIQPSGAELRYEYDDAGRLIALEDDQGNRQEYTLDLMGNRTAATLHGADGAVQHTLTQVYNDLGQLHQTIRAGGEADTFAYDRLGRITARTDALSRTTESDYSPLGRLRQQIAPDGGETDFDYNPQGDLTGVTDPTGLTTAYDHNGFGEVTEQISPDTGTTAYDYDSAGNLTSSTDSRGIVTHYTYDALNRLTRIEYPADPSQNVTFSYDDTRDGNPGIGRLTGISDASGSTAYRYNALGQVTEKIVTVDTDIGPTTGSVHYQYDAAGQLTQITYPSGRVVDYTLDSQGRPQAIHTRDHDQAASDTLIDNIHYRPFGPPEAYDYGNGLTHRRDYDLDYRLTQIQVSGTEPLLSRQYQYDAAGNILAIDNSVNPQASQSFAYDALDRLTQAEGLYGQESYSYDPVGNRLSRSHQSPNTNTQIEENYGYASDSHRLLYLDQSTDGLPSLTRDFVYDEAGNPIQRTGADGAEQDLTYNAANRMAQAEIDYQVTAQYTHNALGQRVRKTVDGLPEPTESLVSEVPGAQGRLRGLENQRAAAQRRLERLQEQIQQRPARHHDRLQSQIDDQRERVAHIDEQIGELTHTPGPDIPPEQITHYNEQGQRLGDYTDTGEPLREYLYFDRLLVGLVDYTDNPQGVVYHIHNDHLGTPQMATDASQHIVWQGDYHPFGEVIPNANNTINLLPRFPGQYSDGETGLYYNYFRDYDPSVGRYVQSDPIGLDGGINTYSYVHNNPLRYIDPDGLKSVPSKFNPVAFLQKRAFQAICFAAEITYRDYDLRSRGIDTQHKSELDRIKGQCDQEYQICYNIDCAEDRVNCIRNVSKECQKERDLVYYEWAKKRKDLEEEYGYSLALYRFCNIKVGE